MKFLALLALGLASASTTVASVCKLPASSPSPSPSSTPSGPSVPAPVCVSNVIQNGYFGSGSLDQWTVTAFGGAAVTGSTSCGQYSSCATLDTVTGGYASISQTVANTGVGLIYTFALNYRAVTTLYTDATLVCQINGGANGLSWSWKYNQIPVGNYGYFMTTFEATTTSITVSCAVSGSYANPVQVDYLNLHC
ncbi:hypothetical protein SBRCBS47491_009057 [Sporothrix bragantina]|uniref:Ig-like domain-containing protein n=1 Tax=Sporothrix bragantina TaxID=671064 RepID=A0ABP0CRJ0_9PEZI